MDRKVDIVIQKAIECIEKKQNFLIQGGAGSGKTESLKDLLNKVSIELKDIKVVCITHTNTAVDEIKSRTKNQYPVYTIHTFLYSLIKNYKKNIKTVLPEIFKIETLENCRIRNEKLKVDFDIYKEVYQKFWKKNYKINSGAYTEKIIR